MNEAIKLAIDSGYTPNLTKQESLSIRYEGDNSVTQEWNSFAEISQDSLFWQALGKALGLKCPRGGHRAEYCGNAWRFYAHQYFDLVLTGGDTGKFWKELLAKD